jgi:hypothetical protein
VTSVLSPCPPVRIYALCCKAFGNWSTPPLFLSTFFIHLPQILTGGQGERQHRRPVVFKLIA